MSRDEETVRLLATLIRLQVDNQTQAILELGRAGFGPTRIASLVGTTSDTAKVTLARARKTTAARAVVPDGG